MNVQRRRATVIKAPDGTPGLLSVDGVQRSYCMTGVWRSSAAPAPNLMVDAALDDCGRVLEIVVVDGSQLARERVVSWVSRLYRPRS